jgi:DNA adenine methylase
MGNNRGYFKMFQPVIKWSGSKRTQEVAGDVCKPLINLWNLIMDNPEVLIKSYRESWKRLQKEGYQVYYEIRDSFNKEEKPEDLFFLSRTCVNGLIRFNKNGKFNNSLHHTRKGIHPDRAEKVILDWSNKIKKVSFIHGNYRKTTKTATSEDFIYLDPPYFNTKGRYFGTIDYEEFLEFLEDLNKRKIKFVLSYDGMRGNKIYLKDLPKPLYKRHVLLDSGNSSFRKVMDKTCESVKESVYLNF